MRRFQNVGCRRSFCHFCQIVISLSLSYFQLCLCFLSWENVEWHLLLRCYSLVKKSTGLSWRAIFICEKYFSGNKMYWFQKSACEVEQTCSTGSHFVWYIVIQEDATDRICLWNACRSQFCRKIGCISRKFQKREILSSRKVFLILKLVQYNM